MTTKNTFSGRLAKKLSRTRTPGVEIVIKSGAGSLLSRRNNQNDLETTRLSLAALRKNASDRRQQAELKDASSRFEPSESDVVATIYTKPACVQCNATYRAFDKAGLNYRSVDISVDSKALEYIRGLGYMQAPVVVTNTGESWSGFRPDKIQELSDEQTHGMLFRRLV